MGGWFPAKALVVMKITEIYGCKPGDGTEPGEKLL
jgi:hypothetical protein